AAEKRLREGGPTGDAKPPEDTAERVRRAQAELEKVDARLEDLRRRDVELRQKLFGMPPPEERRKLDAELGVTNAEYQQNILLKARLRRDLEALRDEEAGRGDDPRRKEGLAVRREALGR